MGFEILEEKGYFAEEGRTLAEKGKEEQTLERTEAVESRRVKSDRGKSEH